MSEDLVGQGFVRLCEYYNNKPNIPVDENLLHVINFGLLSNYRIVKKHKYLFLADRDGVQANGIISNDKYLFTLAFNAALTDMPEDERTPFILYMLCGLTLREIEQIDGVHYSTTARRIQRGTARMRKDLINNAFAL